MKAAIYLRVSTAEQVSNLSLGTQEQACRDYCARLGLEVDRVFREEGESAKTADRTQLAALLAYLGGQRRKVGALVFYRIDRLSRNRDDFYAIRAALLRLGVKLHSASERIEEDTVAGLIVETFSVLQAQVDNMDRSRKTKTGMRAAVERGRWVWTAPLGYIMAGGRLEPDPERAPLLRLAFERIASGLYSVEQVRRELLERGLRTRAGKVVARATLDKLLSNPLYAGRVVAKGFGLYAEGTHEPIVTLETFQRAQRALRRGTAAPARPYVTGATELFPLRGTLGCECAGKVTAYNATGRGGKRFPFYRCTACGCNIAARIVDARFAELLESLTAPAWSWELFETIVRKRGEALLVDARELARAAKARATTAKGRLERLNRAYIYDGAIDPDTYRSEKDRLQTELLEAEAGAEAARPDSKLEPALRLARRVLLSPVAAWDSCRPSNRPTLSRALFPAGLVWERAGKIRTPAKSLLYLPLGASGEADFSDGTPASEHLEPWLSSFAALEPVLDAA